MLHAVVMAGGTGTRFWPQSRHTRPKQLLPLAGPSGPAERPRTLIQATVDRVAAEVPPDRTWIVTNAAQADGTAEQLPQVPVGNLLIEPCGRNTAPCIGLAAIHLLHNDPDAVMLVMPADHVIRPDDVFLSAVQTAVRAVHARPDSLILFGVPPDRPATGYGYMERGERRMAFQAVRPDSVGQRAVHGEAEVLTDGLESPPADEFRYEEPAVFRVASFREKPEETVAKEYLAAGNFYWNCGIFVWRADRILAALRDFEPQIHDRLLTLQSVIGTDRWQQTLETEFPQMNKISIDYAVLERSNNVCVIEAPFEWDDVGSWESLLRLLGTDAAGNAVDARHVGLDTERCIIRSTDDRHVVATIGVEDLIIVHTPDATLVCRRGDDAAIRTLVDELKARGYDDVL